VWLFVVPFVFVFFHGQRVQRSGTPSNPRPGVLIENADTNFLGTVLMDELNAQGCA
jgi:hypothetical protein